MNVWTRTAFVKSVRAPGAGAGRFLGSVTEPWFSRHCTGKEPRAPLLCRQHRELRKRQARGAAASAGPACEHLYRQVVVMSDQL